MHISMATSITLEIRLNGDRFQLLLSLKGRLCPFSEATQICAEEQVQMPYS